MKTFRGRICICTAALFFLAAVCAHAQWRLQTSGTAAGLRGIHSVDGTVAWASGTHGTVLRTVDGGRHWQSCADPPNASKLDFRSVWAWDANHAMVMSSGPGQQSKLFSTHDGCRTWRLIFTNPDANGFWDALQFSGTRFGAIFGDPVNGKFTLFLTRDGGGHWVRQLDSCLTVMEKNQGAFAASNGSLAVLPIGSPNVSPGFESAHQLWFGVSGGWLYGMRTGLLHLVSNPGPGCIHRRVFPNADGPSSGIFAVAFRDATHGVAVGGNYAKPQFGGNTAAYTNNGTVWQLSKPGPSGYRSTVAWDNTNASWIAAGPNGTDMSRDDGRTWRKIDNDDWNALSLPFAVGPDGRIGRLISWGEMRAAGPVLVRDLKARGGK